MLKKAELTERLATIRKAFEKLRKDKEAAANKAVSDPQRKDLPPVPHLMP